MALHSFCGILTLQVGVAIIAVVFWVIAMLTFVVNFFEFFESSSFPVYALTISTFVILLVLGGLIAFFSAYNESNALCMAGVALLALTTIVWVTISSLSFYNDQAILNFVCIHDRCPETFWLAPLKYRLENKLSQNVNTSGYYPEYQHETTNKEPEPSTESSEETPEVTHEDHEPISQYTDQTDEPEPTYTYDTVPDETVSEGRKKRNTDSYSNVLPVTDPQDAKILRKRTFENVESSFPELDDAVYYIDSDTTGDDVPTSEVTKSGYIFGLPLVGAVILFICNFFLFLFSILVLWSYGQELAWTNTYLQDIPEYAHT